MTNQDVNNSQDGKKNLQPHLKFFSDTSLIIGIATILGYLVAYNYRKGFRSFYYIDDTFINNITLTDVIISVAATLGVSLIILNFYPFFKNLLVFDKEKKHVSFRYILKYWLISPLFVLTILKVFFNFSYSILIFIAIFYTLIFVLPTLIASFFNEGKNWGEKFKNTILNSGPNFKEVVKFNVLESTQGFLLGLFGAFILIGPIASIIGYSDATKKDEYYTFEFNNNTYIVLDDYNENLIIAPYNSRTNHIESTFQIIESKSTLEQPLKLDVVKLSETPSVTPPSSK